MSTLRCNRRVGGKRGVRGADCGKTFLWKKVKTVMWNVYNSRALRRREAEPYTQENVVIYPSDKFWLWRQRTNSRPYRRWGSGTEVWSQPDRRVICYIFLAGKRAMLLGNLRFSWLEIAWPCCGELTAVKTGLPLWNLHVFLPTKFTLRAEVSLLHGF